MPSKRLNLNLNLLLLLLLLQRLMEARCARALKPFASFHEGELVLSNGAANAIGVVCSRATGPSKAAKAAFAGVSPASATEVLQAVARAGLLLDVGAVVRLLREPLLGGAIVIDDDVEEIVEQQIVPVEQSALAVQPVAPAGQQIVDTRVHEKFQGMSRDCLLLAASRLEDQVPALLICAFLVFNCL